MIRDRLAGAQERPTQVDVDYATPRLVAHVDDGGALEDARVVDQDVEPAEARDDLLEQRDDLRFDGDVGGHDQHVGAEAAQLVRGLGEPGTVARRDDEVGALRRERAGDPLPYPRSAAGNRRLLFRRVYPLFVLSIAAHGPGSAAEYLAEALGGL